MKPGAVQGAVSKSQSACGRGHSEYSASVQRVVASVQRVCGECAVSWRVHCEVTESHLLSLRLIV